MVTSVSPFPSAVPARAVVPPPEFEDVVTWAAWLYYVDELTQSDVAHRLGVSRASVANYLHDARERGTVVIRIATEAVERTALSRRLADVFGLAAASVIPSVPGRAAVDRLGEAGARILADQLAPGDTIGVAWGKTVLAAARAMPALERRDVTVVQVAGSGISTENFSPEFCTAILANQLGARCVNLHAPAILSTPRLRDLLMEEPSLSRQFEMIHSATRIIFGVGDLGSGSTYVESGIGGADALDTIARTGAAGVLLGRLIDAAGRPLETEIERHMIGLSLQDLKGIPTRLCIAGGLEKVGALRAALRGGYVTHLVTESETAEALLTGA
ncbi:AsnC family transcriptional regulator [Aurantimonas sp. Leaf443]|nr:AsnC family transcriptional regulator [Aurantimonas sp. Leaf443]